MSLLQYMLLYSRTASTCALSEILDGFFLKFKAATKAYFAYFTTISLRWFGVLYWLVKVVMFIKVKGPNSCFLQV